MYRVRVLYALSLMYLIVHNSIDVVNSNITSIEQIVGDTSMPAVNGHYCDFNSHRKASHPHTLSRFKSLPSGLLGDEPIVRGS